MKRNPIVVYGASGHGKVVVDAAICSGHEIVGFIDDDATKREKELHGFSVVAIGLKEFSAKFGRSDVSIAMGIGDNKIRARLFSEVIRQNLKLCTVIHPKSVIAASVKVGRGTVIFAGAVVNPDARIGENVIVNTGSVIEHDNMLESNVHISPGVSLGGNVRIGNGTHVGIGTAVKNNIVVGSWSVIGAGSVIVKDVPDNTLAYGVPAKVIKEINL